MDKLRAGHTARWLMPLATVTKHTRARLNRSMPRRHREEETTRRSASLITLKGTRLEYLTLEDVLESTTAQAIVSISIKSSDVDVIERIGREREGTEATGTQQSEPKAPPEPPLELAKHCS